MKPIRLLAFIEAKSITGPAKNLLQFVQLLDQSRGQRPVDVSIATFDRGGNSKVFAEAVRRSGIPFHVIHERGRFDLAVLHQLAKVVGRAKPDLIQTHAVKSHFLVRLSRLHQKARWVAIHHGYTWPDWRMRLYNQLDRWSLAGADRILTVSDAFRRDLIQRGVPAGRIEVLHNSIDPNWASALKGPHVVRALREQLGVGADQKVILNVGRLSEEKDQATLIRVLHRLRNDRARSKLKPHLVIVGDGPRRESLERMSSELGVRDAVSFVGHVASAAPYYGIADVCVLSSLSEGSPNALLEAMVTRVPVVATSVGGVTEIVRDQESALLVKPRDEKEMAHAIADVLTRPSLAAGLVARAYKQVTTRHAPETYKKRLIGFYEGALSTDFHGSARGLPERFGSEPRNEKRADRKRSVSDE